MSASSRPGRRRICALVAAALAAAVTARPAAAISPYAGTGGAAFLQLKQGSARAMALGNAAVAMVDGADGLLYNPAALGLAQQREIDYSYMRYVQGLNTPLYMAYAHPLGRTVWGANIDYINDSNFDVRDANGIPQPGTNIRVNDGYGTVAVARSFWYEKLYLGAAVREVHEDNAGNLHDSVVGDVGIIVRPNETVSLAAAYQDFGTSVYNVASIARAGASFHIGDLLTLGFEINKAADDNPRAGIGAEFVVPEEYLEYGQLAFRVGYYSADYLGQSFNSTLVNLHLDQTSGVSFGFGLFTSQAFGYGLGLDYAFVPFGALGTIDQVSIKLKF